MTKRPIPVMVIGGLLALIGVVGFFVHLHEMQPQHAFEGDHPSILITEIVALVAGIFLLRGANWARWLAIAWMAFRVVLSFHDPAQRLIVHMVFLALFAFFLFQPSANAYFRHG
jgi:hypothetical protein